MSRASYASVPLADSSYPPSIASDYKDPLPPSPTPSGHKPLLYQRSSIASSINQGETRARPKELRTLFLRGWLVSLLIAVMFILAIATEVLLWWSENIHGWRISGLETFGGINFLKSVVPVVVIAPISIMWLSVDETLGRFHPYIMLSRGDVSASESVLLDYTSGRAYTMYYAIKFGHWVVLFSSFICLGNLVLSPLASGVLTTKVTNVDYLGVPVTLVRSIGLDPDYATLEYFAAASGYAMAAAIHNLTDPPFVFKQSWSIGEFSLPPSQGQGVNETAIVPTTGIESSAGCEAADTTDLDNSTGAAGGTMFITGTWDGCTVQFNATLDGKDQYGVLPVANCETHPEADPFKPVLFWFFNHGLAQVDLVFCKPSIELWNVRAEASMSTGLIVDVTLVDKNVAPNTISGSPINGVSFNGINFNTTGVTDKYVLARALSIESGVPGAIYRGADMYGGPTAVAQSEFAWINVTEKVYSRFLAIAGQTTYFSNSNATALATVNSAEIRLWVYPMAAHGLAAFLAAVGILATFVHISHARSRRHVFMATESPSTIGAVVAMTSSAKFTSLLHPDMDELAMKRALRGMRFGISSRSWQVVARGEEEHGPGHLSRDSVYRAE